MTAERSLTQRDAIRVLGRAQEIALASSGDDGLTPEHLKQAADEVGLDGAAVEQALHELSHIEHKNAIAWLGAQIRFVSFKTVAGTLSDARLEALGEMIREHTGEVVPEMQVEGTTSRWSTMEDIAVEVSPSSAGTSITVATDRRQDVISSGVGFGTLGFVMAIVGTKLLGASGVPEVAGVLAASLSGSWLGLRLYWQRTAGSWQRRLDDLGAAVAAQVERLVPDTERDS